MVLPFAGAISPVHRVPFPCEDFPRDLEPAQESAASAFAWASGTPFARLILFFDVPVPKLAGGIGVWVSHKKESEQGIVSESTPADMRFRSLAAANALPSALRSLFAHQ